MPSSLAEAQRWLLAAIVDPSQPTEFETQVHLAAGPAQLPDERLAIYRHAYLARLLEVLRELFPCTRFAVGDELFDRLLIDYIHAHPPSSYTLAKLPDQLVAFLDATRPPDWGLFVVELARLEHAIDLVFDGPGGEQLPPFQLPATASGDLRLVLTPSLTLLAFRYPVSTYFTSWKAGREPQWPEPEKQHIALLRRDYIVRRYELTPEQYPVLELLQAGKSLDEVMSSLAAAGQDLDRLAKTIGQWFESWAGESFFSSAY